MSTTGKLMTAAELLRLPDDGQRHELVAGELRSMAPSGGEHGRVIIKLTVPFATYIEAHGLGAVFGAETGFLLAVDPDTVLAPDLAFVRRERVEAVGNERSYWPGAPDLVAEVISPNDLYTEVEEKVAAWLAYGARMVLVLNPRRRTVSLHRPDRPVRVLTDADVLDGED